MIITVEDHYSAGGIGDAVSEAVAAAGFAVRRLAVREIPRSGQPDELLDRYGISASHIVDAVKRVDTPVARIVSRPSLVLAALALVDRRAGGAGAAAAAARRP